MILEFKAPEEDRKIETFIVSHCCYETQHHDNTATCHMKQKKKKTVVTTERRE